GTGCFDHGGFTRSIFASEIAPLHASSVAGNVILPNRFAGPLVQGNQETSLAGTKIHKAQVAIEDWRGGINPHVRLLAQIAMPRFPSAQFVTIAARRAEPRNDAPPVRHR